MLRVSKEILVAGLVILTFPIAAQTVWAQGSNIHNDRPVPNGPTYGDILRVGLLERYVFPAQLGYKGIGVTRDRVIVRYLRTDGRGGFWFEAYARYSGSIPPVNIGVAERATLRYDNGAIRVDLGGMKGALNTRSVGEWLTRNLPLNQQPRPVPPPLAGFRTGELVVANNYGGAITVNLYHPANPSQVFAFWQVGPSKTQRFILEDKRLTIGSDWPIEVIFGNGVRSPRRAVSQIAWYDRDQFHVRASAIFNGQ